MKKLLLLILLTCSSAIYSNLKLDIDFTGFGCEFQKQIPSMNIECQNSLTFDHQNLLFTITIVPYQGSYIVKFKIGEKRGDANLEILREPILRVNLGSNVILEDLASDFCLKFKLTQI